MAFPFKFTAYLTQFLLSVSHSMICLPSAAFFFMQCLFPAVPHPCRVSRTLLSFWYAYSTATMASTFKFTAYLTQPFLSVSDSMICLPPASFCSCSVSFLPSLIPVMSLAHYSPFGMLYNIATMALYLQIHCLPNVASSFSNSFHDCLPSAVFCSCGVSFLPSLFPVMSLAHHFLFGMLNSTATMASPFKFNAYLMQLLLSVSHPMTCLPPAAFFSCNVSFCRPSLLSCLSPFILFLVCFTLCLFPAFPLPAVSLAHYSL